MAAHRFIEALLDDRPLPLFGDGRQVRDFTYVEDVVDATVRALFADLPRAAVLDVASGHPTDVATLIAQLRSLVGRDAVPLELLEERPGDVPRTAGEIATAREHLGWSPRTDLRSGLLRQVDWHRPLRVGAPARLRTRHPSRRGAAAGGGCLSMGANGVEPRLLIYSQDGLGLGHLRRTTLLAGEFLAR